MPISRGLTALLDNGAGGKGVILAGLWVRDQLSGDDVRLIQNLADAESGCGLKITALVYHPSQGTQPFTIPPQLHAYADGAELLNDNRLDVVLFMGFIDGRPDGTVALLPSPSPADLPLSIGLLRASGAGKDTYIFPGVGAWAPIQRSCLRLLSPRRKFGLAEPDGNLPGRSVVADRFDDSPESIRPDECHPTAPIRRDRGLRPALRGLALEPPRP
jgi:hypothetical protein